MDTQAQNATISFPSVINLNVGGQIYTTSLATLTKYSESMLGAMFSGRFAAQKDSNGDYFIDRDGALFRYILGFLRNGELHVPENFHEFGSLLKEAEFFQIPALTDAVKHQMEGRDGHKNNKPEQMEVITVFGDAANGLVRSVSGRLRTLIEMLHCSDRETEKFQIFPYCNQSDRTDSERTGILAVKDGFHYSITINSVIGIAKMYGFKVTSDESHPESLNLGYRGNKHCILSRPIPKR